MREQREPMMATVTVSEVSRAYGARSAEYIELFGEIDAAAEADRNAVLAWARGITGPIIDVGCGPGQWTHFLREHELDVEGVDPTPEFVVAAQRRYPGIRFRIGRAERLDVDAESLGGILAWYSLIHTDPELIDSALTGFARCVRPGGGLALGFFEGGPELTPVRSRRDDRVRLAARALVRPRRGVRVHRHRSRQTHRSRSAHARIHHRRAESAVASASHSDEQRSEIRRLSEARRSPCRRSRRVPRR